MKGIICMLLSVLLFCLLICAAELPAYRPACEAERVVEPDLPWHAGQARRH